MNETIDDIRKRIYRTLSREEKGALGKVKYTVLYSERNQSEKHQARMENIRMMLPELALAFDLKEEFSMIFECGSAVAARRAFADWYSRVKESGIQEMIEMADRMMDRLDEILPWFSHRISNGIAEGINNSLQKIKSAAYGFRKVENFIRLCYFRKGRIPISVRCGTHRRSGCDDAPHRDRT